MSEPTLYGIIWQGLNSVPGWVDDPKGDEIRRRAFNALKELEAAHAREVEAMRTLLVQIAGGDAKTYDHMGPLCTHKMRLDELARLARVALAASGSGEAKK